MPVRFTLRMQICPPRPSPTLPVAVPVPHPTRRPPRLPAVLKAHPGRLIVLMASVTWCRPCKGFQEKYEKMAQHYQGAVFLKFYGGPWGRWGPGAARVGGARQRWGAVRASALCLAL